MEDFHHVSLMSEDDKPWKRDLVRTAANRREQVAAQLETDIQAAPSFEEALRLAVDSLKKKFARYTAVSAYVADGEDLAMLTAANRPTGPERVGSGGPLADAARNPRSTMISNITEESAWKAVGLTVEQQNVSPSNYINYFIDPAAWSSVDAFATSNYGDYADPDDWGSGGGPGGRPALLQPLALRCDRRVHRATRPRSAGGDDQLRIGIDQRGQPGGRAHELGHSRHA